MKSMWSFLIGGAIALAVFAVASSPATAGILVNGPISNSMTGTNDFLANPLNGFYGGSASAWQAASLTTDQSGTLIFTYHASESGFKNSFTATPGGTLSESSTGTEGWNTLGYSTFSVTGNASYLNGVMASLKFTSDQGAVAAISGNSAERERFAIFGKSTLSGPPTTADFLAADGIGRFYFGYDDNGAGPDDNHDDMIISMEFFAHSVPGDPVVPEPATLAIWSIGLGVAGLVRLRRKK